MCMVLRGNHKFDGERLRGALAMKRPGEIYRGSPRHDDGLPEPTDPFHGRDILVTACERLRLHRKHPHRAAGHKRGIKEVDDAIWPAGVMRLGRIRHRLAEGEDLGRTFSA